MARTVTSDATTMTVRRGHRRRFPPAGVVTSDRAPRRPRRARFGARWRGELDGVGDPGMADHNTSDIGSSRCHLCRMSAVRPPMPVAFRGRFVSPAASRASSDPPGLGFGNAGASHFHNSLWDVCKHPAGTMSFLEFSCCVRFSTARTRRKDVRWCRWGGGGSLSYPRRVDGRCLASGAAVSAASRAGRIGQSPRGDQRHGCATFSEGDHGQSGDLLGRTGDQRAARGAVDA